MVYFVGSFYYAARSKVNHMSKPTITGHFVPVGSCGLHSWLSFIATLRFACIMRHTCKETNTLIATLTLRLFVTPMNLDPLSLRFAPLVCTPTTSKHINSTCSFTHGHEVTSSGIVNLVVWS